MLFHCVLLIPVENREATKVKDNDAKPSNKIIE